MTTRKFTIGEVAMFAIEAFFMLVAVALLVLGIIWAAPTIILGGVMNLLLWGFNIYLTVSRRKARLDEERRAAERASRPSLFPDMFGEYK